MLYPAPENSLIWSRLRASRPGVASQWRMTSGVMRASKASGQRLFHARCCWTLRKKLYPQQVSSPTSNAWEVDKIT
jgi:hypothetical protein